MYKKAFTQHYNTEGCPWTRAWKPYNKQKRWLKLKKPKKDWKKVLTKGRRFGNLTKLSGSTAGCTTERRKKPKKVVDKWKLICYNGLPPIKRRVPCKLNNVTNEKHQTDGSKEPTKSSGLRVESITEGAEQKNEAMEIALWKISSSWKACVDTIL